MNNCVSYEIYLEEPLKMGTQGNQNNTESLTYVAGSALRGAILGKFIDRYCKDSVQDLDKSEYAGVLFQNTRFFDAYPVRNGKALMPVPFVYYADKHAVRAAQKKAETGIPEAFALHSCAGQNETPKEGEQRIDIGKYCYMEDDTLYTASVSQDANLHIALTPQGEDNKMFRYEAIAKGQTFAGVIQCGSEEDAKKYCDVLEQSEILYVGGSKGSGYGRCRICKAEQVSFAKICEDYVSERAQKENTLLVYALSNLILVDEWGRVTGNIAPQFLEEKLGITEVRLEQSFLSTFRTAGFNHKWRARQMQQTAVRAGSVYVYSYKGTLDESRMTALEECGIGQRKPEGFGRIILNPQLGQTKRVSKGRKEHAIEEVVLTDADKLLLNKMSALMNQDREADVLRREAYAAAQRSKGVLKEFSLTQLSRLYGELQNMFAVNITELEEEKAKQQIREIYSEKIKTKTKDAYKKAELSLTKQSKYMITVLEELADDSIPIASWNQNLAAVKKVSLTGETKENGTSDFVLKGRLLMEVLYNLMRMEGAKG